MSKAFTLSEISSILKVISDRSYMVIGYRRLTVKVLDRY